MLTRDMTRLGKHGKAMESIPNLGELWVTKNQLVDGEGLAVQKF